MSYFRPPTGISLAESLDRKSKEKQLRRSYHWKSKQQFLAASHAWRLSVGNNPVGPAFTMTGFEAAKRNKELEAKFIAALDQNKPARLSRWMIAVVEQSVGQQ